MIRTVLIACASHAAAQTQGRAVAIRWQASDRWYCSACGKRVRGRWVT